jgi:hypothetical protein
MDPSPVSDVKAFVPARDPELSKRPGREVAVE